VEHPNNKNDVGPVTEMSIVNTFTKLIFGDEANSARELLIIEEFRAVDANVLHDSPQEMGEYLRSLGVREMIQLVSRLRQHINDNVEAPAAKKKRKAHPGANLTSLRPDRDTR
jgi:hypothetical protein